MTQGCERHQVCDVLIVEFGSAQLRMIGVKGKRSIVAHMKLLAIFLQTMHKKLECRKSLYNLLNGSYFDAAVEAVEEICGLTHNEHGQRQFNMPSLILHWETIE